MREAVNINLGLLALKKCIDALNSNASYVPYQDSKLTMLLSEGLGGNSQTSIVVCASMDEDHVSETVSTLRFGEKCSKIEKDIHNRRSVMEQVLRGLDAEIAEMERRIALKEKWVVQESIRVDGLAEEGSLEAALGNKEVVKVSILTGAEDERRLLEELLRKRYEFTGVPLDTLLNKNKLTSGNVIGFGKAYAEIYNIGQKYDSEQDLVENNERFANQVETSRMPKLLQSKKGVTGWKSGNLLEGDGKKLEEEADKAKRSKLVYAGLSA